MMRIRHYMKQAGLLGVPVYKWNDVTISSNVWEALKGNWNPNASWNHVNYEAVSTKARTDDGCIYEAATWGLIMETDVPGIPNHVTGI